MIRILTQDVGNQGAFQKVLRGKISLRVDHRITVSHQHDLAGEKKKKKKKTNRPMLYDEGVFPVMTGKD